MRVCVCVDEGGCSCCSSGAWLLLFSLMEGSSLERADMTQVDQDGTVTLMYDVYAWIGSGNEH